MVLKHTFHGTKYDLILLLDHRKRFDQNTKQKTDRPAHLPTDQSLDSFPLNLPASPCGVAHVSLVVAVRGSIFPAPNTQDLMELSITNNCNDTITELILSSYLFLPSNLITPDARIISYDLPAVHLRVSPSPIQRFIHTRFATRLHLVKLIGSNRI